MANSHALLALLCAALWSLGLAAPQFKDDTCSVIEENLWFKAEHHGPQLLEFMRGARDLQRGLHCLDIFGASGRVKHTWEDAGFRAAGFDIRLSNSHDICGETGVKILLRMGLEMVDEGILLCAPPCSLHVAACASVHQRTRANPAGNQNVFKVRLAQRIWKNFAIAIALILSFRPSLFVVIEQPTSSWGFKQDFMVQLSASYNLFIILVWLGFWGHDLHKPTHLLGNLRSLWTMERTMRTADRKRISRRLEMRQLSRAIPKEYYSRKTRADGTTYWQGGKNLPETAVWPWAFCRGLLLRWEDQVRGSLGRRALHNQVPDADMILISDAEDE